MPENPSSAAHHFENQKPNPELLKPLIKFVDLVQSCFVEAYGLRDLRLEKASTYLWPLKTSPAAEMTISNEVRSGVFKAFFTTDTVPMRPSLVDKVRFSPLVRRSFKDHHPVLYLDPSLVADVNDVGNLGVMINPDKIYVFGMIGEEVGHFTYKQSQLRLNGKLPGAVISESVGLLDLYQLLKAACRDANLDSADLQNPQVAEVISALDKRIERFKNVQSLEFSYYRDSARIVEGLLIYLMDQDSKGIDTTSELKQFYRLSTPDKFTFLHNLYTRLLTEGDEEYEYYLNGLNSSSIKGHSEFKQK